MNPNKSSEEILYDAIADLFKLVQGHPSALKLEQMRRTSKLFSDALDNVSERSVITVFERLQDRVHKAFVAMEKDADNLAAKVDAKQAEVDEKIAQFEKQSNAVKELVEDLGAQLRKLDRLFKGLAQ